MPSPSACPLSPLGVHGWPLLIPPPHVENLANRGNMKPRSRKDREFFVLRGKERGMGDGTTAWFQTFSNPQYRISCIAFMGLSLIFCCDEVSTLCRAIRPSVGGSCANKFVRKILVPLISARASSLRQLLPKDVDSDILGSVPRRATS
jgi:hypothetical protein